MPKACESPIEETFWKSANEKLAAHEITLVKPPYEVGPYSADFVVPSKKIAVELDGHGYHSTNVSARATPSGSVSVSSPHPDVRG